MSCGVTAAWSAVPVTGWNVRSAVNTSGWRPDTPNALRSLSVLMKPSFQNGSSLITHVPATLGYVARSKLSPNALLLSTRTAPVRNNRSFHPSCSCA